MPELFVMNGDLLNSEDALIDLVSSKEERVCKRPGAVDRDALRPAPSGALGHYVYDEAGQPRAADVSSLV